VASFLTKHSAISGKADKDSQRRDSVIVQQARQEALMQIPKPSSSNSSSAATKAAPAPAAAAPKADAKPALSKLGFATVDGR
jgi:hypothetical protein